MAKIQLNLSDIRKKYRLASSHEDKDRWTLCDKDAPDKVYGDISLDKTKIYFHGFPDAAPRRITAMEELEHYVSDFLKECHKRWVDPRGLVSLYNKGTRVAYALWYIANRLDLASAGRYGSGEPFVIGSKYFDCGMFTVRCADQGFDGCSFYISYNNGSFTKSPHFTDYMSAIEWLQSAIVPIMFLVGSDILCKAAELEPRESRLGDATIEKLNFSSPELFDVKPLKEVMMDVLEKQLKKLKEEEQ